MHLPINIKLLLIYKSEEILSNKIEKENMRKQRKRKEIERKFERERKRERESKRSE